MEHTNHPFMAGTQFHPEFLSRPSAPHPMFMEFVRVASELNGGPASSVATDTKGENGASRSESTGGVASGKPIG